MNEVKWRSPDYKKGVSDAIDLVQMLATDTQRSIPHEVRRHFHALVEALKYMRGDKQAADFEQEE